MSDERSNRVAKRSPPAWTDVGSARCRADIVEAGRRCAHGSATPVVVGPLEETSIRAGNEEKVAFSNGAVIAPEIVIEMSISADDMQPSWKILAPIESGPDAGAIIDHAIDFTGSMRGELTLLHATGRPSSTGTQDFRWPARLPDAHPTLNIRRVVLPGEPSETIRRYADFMNANIVFMGWRARAKWTRPWKKSVTLQVLGSTRRAVHMVRLTPGDVDYRPRCRKLVCVLNLDGTDDAVIACGTAIAARCGAEVTVVHVIPEVSEATLAWGHPQYDRPLSQAVAMDRIRDLKHKFPAGYATAVMSGELHKCIANAARQAGADLIVASRALPGTWAPACPDPRAMLRRVACPVVSVPVSVAPVREQRVSGPQRIPQAAAHRSSGLA